MQEENALPAEKESTFAMFHGGGERYWDGVPARDLTQSEWAQITSNVQNHLLKIGLYTLVKKGGK